MAIAASTDQQVERVAFNALFANPQKNRDELFKRMANLVRIVAACNVRCRIIDDLDEIKGEGLRFGMALAMSPDSKFDPTRGTAFDYFYSALKSHMVKLASKHQADTLGDAAFEISFDELRAISPQDAARVARSNAVKNWKTFRLEGERDRQVASKFLRHSIKQAEAACPRISASLRKSKRSRAERSATVVIIHTLKQVQRALLG